MGIGLGVLAANLSGQQGETGSWKLGLIRAALMFSRITLN
jgi:hypothetical protein